jgi:hypothetical protein
VSRGINPLIVMFTLLALVALGAWAIDRVSPAARRARALRSGLGATDHRVTVIHRYAADGALDSVAWVCDEGGCTWTAGPYGPDQAVQERAAADSARRHTTQPVGPPIRVDI